MNEIKDLQHLFNKTGLYSKETFNVFIKKQDRGYSVVKEQLFRLALYLGLGSSKIESHCTTCKKDYPFDYKVSVVNDLHNNNLKNTMVLSGYIGVIGSYITFDFWNNKLEYLEGRDASSIKNGIVYLQYDFFCTNVDKTHYMMNVMVEIKDTKVVVQKIGQFPSLLDIYGDDFRDYESILNKYGVNDDYRKSFITYSEGYYVASFVYLRRVLEKIVDAFARGKILKDDYFKTKVEATKENFDPDLHGSLSNLYKVMSAGVHSLSEEKCRDYYSFVKAIIEIQLEYMKSKDEHEKKVSKNVNALNSIATSFNKGDE